MLPFERHSRGPTARFDLANQRQSRLRSLHLFLCFEVHRMRVPGRRRRKLTFRLRTARDSQRSADLRKRSGRARDGSLGQSGAPPQEPEPSRIIGALAGAQDRCPAGIPVPLPGHKSILGARQPGASRGTAVPRSAPGYRRLPLPGVIHVPPLVEHCQSCRPHQSLKHKSDLSL